MSIYSMTPEDRKLIEKIRNFVSDVPKQLILDMDEDKIKYPKEFLQEAGKRGLLGLRFDPRWGGKGVSWCSELLALEEIGVLGTALGCLYSLVSIVGEAIDKFGTEDQKEKYLKPMIAGKIGVAEGLTEPRGGSDFFGATTIAKRKGNMFYLTGQKRFVVGADGSDLILVYAKVDGVTDPKKAMTAFLVERSPDIKVEYLYGLMGTRGGGTGRLVFNKTPVPVENVLGGEAGIGNGTKVFYQMMIPERLTSAGAAVGMGRAAIQIAADYANKRKAFGKKIREFEAVSFKISDSITLLDASRGINHIAGKAVDMNLPAGTVRRLVSEAKKFSTDSAWKVVNNAMQIMGGIGYTNIYPIERLLRDTRLITIWTGTNEIMDLIIQHEFYKELLSNPIEGRNIEQDAVGSEFSDEKVYGE